MDLTWWQTFWLFGGLLTLTVIGLVSFWHDYHQKVEARLRREMEATTEPMEFHVYAARRWERPFIWLRLRRGPLQRALDSVPPHVKHSVKINVHPGAYEYPRIEGLHMEANLMIMGVTPDDVEIRVPDFQGWERAKLRFLVWLKGDE